MIELRYTGDSVVLDLQRRALARLLHAHEMQLIRPALTHPAADLTPTPVRAFVTDGEGPASVWRRPFDEEGFGLWDEIDQPPGRQSLSAMV